MCITANLHRFVPPQQEFNPAATISEADRDHA